MSVETGKPLEALPALAQLRRWFGNMDIYLFDQLMKGRFVPGMKILDAGCGRGRNLVFFMRGEFEPFAVDESEASIAELRALAERIAPHLPADNFRVESVEHLSFPDASFDVVVANAVLHFAEDEAHFDRMLSQLWRVLAVGGMLFARLATSIGMEGRLEPRQGRRFRLPDGSERFLADEAMLSSYAERLGAHLLEPLKTTLVADQRAMSTWVLRKAR